MIWLHPSYWSNDIPALYHPRRQQEWREVRARVDVMSHEFRVITRFTDEEMRHFAAWFKQDPTKELALIGPLFKEFDCDGTNQYSRNLAALNRCKDYGIEPRYWYADEPGLCAVHRCAAYWMQQGAHGWREIMDLAAERIDALLQPYRDNWPHIQLGVQEPYPALVAEQHEHWARKLLRLGVSFYHVGTAQPPKGLVPNLAGYRRTIDAVRGTRLRVGFIYNGGEAQTDPEYYKRSLNWFPKVRASVEPQPEEHQSYMHWGAWYPQHNLPETGRHTYTRLVLHDLGEV